MDRANRPSRSPATAVIAALLYVCCVQASAFAAEPRGDDTERAEAKVVEAKAFFKGALYPQAAASYLQAFAISHKPATLFNAARAYEEAKHFPEAIALFNQYLLLPDTPADGKREANERIAHDRAQLAAIADAEAARHSAEAVAPMTETKPPEKQKTAKAEEAKPMPVEATPAGIAPVVEVVPQPRQRSWVDWTLFVGGDALVAIGLLGYAGAVNAVTQANVMDFSLPGAEASYKKTVADARTTRTSSAVIGVIGAGLASWGAWRLWGPVAAKSPDNNQKTASWLVPAVGADGAGVTWAGRF